MTDVALPVASATDPLPNCNACHKAPVTNRGFSTCRPCRDKRNEVRKRSKERKRREEFLLFQASTVANLPAATSGEGSSVGKKRKVPADEENSADVMERMKKRFKKMDAFKKVDPASKTSTTNLADPVFEKFGVNTDLYKEIKRRYPDKTTSLRFYGTYAIIAVPSVDNKLRARTVAQDLKDNTKLHFNVQDRKSHRGSDEANTYTVSYKCTCRASSVLKRSASDLSLYFGSKKGAATDDAPKSECRGRIEISAEDDKSHPLGWLGQRVKVTVTHPKKI
ncbi:hypothetical protein DFH07DRAFT_891206 [Mycena maculata]|uniref:Uncharacterized protein n=1 Tax=Mycena maculata TaxID=230809 RepID=A0AAD7IFI0_9AGAR|nr:hypothetical protein DFH07DRAFT_891206 [Mycena maculata]